jgi:hypothetical protein
MDDVECEHWIGFYGVIGSFSLTVNANQVALSFMGMGASTIMYDGSPVATSSALWELVEQYE